MAHTVKTMRWLVFITILFGSTNFYFNDIKAGALGAEEEAAASEAARLAGGVEGDVASAAKLNDAAIEDFSKTDAQAMASEPAFGQGAAGTPAAEPPLEAPTRAAEGMGAPAGSQENLASGDASNVAGTNLGDSGTEDVPPVEQAPVDEGFGDEDPLKQGGQQNDQDGKAQQQQQPDEPKPEDVVGQTPKGEEADAADGGAGKQESTENKDPQQQDQQQADKPAQEQNPPTKPNEAAPEATDEQLEDLRDAQEPNPTAEEQSAGGAAEKETPEQQQQQQQQNASEAGKKPSEYEQASKEFDDAKGKLDELTGGKNPETAVNDAQAKVDDAKTKLDNANSPEEKTAAQKDLDAANNDLRELKNAKAEFEASEGRFEESKAGATSEQKQADVTRKIGDGEKELKGLHDDFENAGISRTKDLEDGSVKVKSNAEMEQEINAKVEKGELTPEQGEELKGKLKRIDELNGELDSLRGELKKLKWDNSWTKYGWDKMKATGEWLKEQICMGFAFMLPGDIVNAFQQEQATKALYDTIAGEQTFGGIKMKAISGLIPRYNPTNGVFIYADTPGDYNSAQRCYFAARNDYGDIAKDYIGASTTHVLNFNTGAVINGSGIVEKVVPLFINLTAPSQNQNQGDVQTVIATQRRFIAGEVKTEAGGQAFSESTSVHTVSASGNKAVAALFTPDTKRLYAPPEPTSAISPLLNSSLNAFAGPTNIPGFGIAVQELQGIGAVTYAFMHYDDLFFADGNDVATGNAILQAVTSGVDITDPQKFPSQKSEKMTNAGFAKGTSLIGQGIYVYQTDSTAVGQFIRAHVNKALQNYVHDYVICVDDNQSIVPALVPKVNSNQSGSIGVPVVQWVPNPNIAYIVSLLTGATFVPGSNGESLKSADGTLDFTVANAAVKSLISNYGGSGALKAQLGSMKFFTEMLIADGPFLLRDGIYAYRVSDLSNKLINIDQSALQKVEALNLLGKAGQGEQLSSKDDDLSVEDKQKMLDEGGGVYVYRIDNVLPGGANGTLLPDYIVPVTVNQATGNYLIVPLGIQAAVQSGSALPRVSTQVTAIISLVTGKVYDSTYTLLPKAFTTDILLAQAPGKPLACPKPPLPQGVVCDGSYRVQSGGTHVPIATAFMETDLNPVNQNRSGNDLVKVWPFYFMLLNYDYSPTGVTTSKGNKQDIANYLEAGFMDINQAAQGASTMSVPLYRVLPQVFTGIPWPASVNAMLNLEATQAQALNQQSTNLATVLTNLQSATGAATQDPTAMTIAQVHAAWRTSLMANAGSQWSLTLAEGPHAFTPGKQGWWLSGEPKAILSQVFLYSVTSPMLGNALKGLWVAAQYGQQGGAVQGTTLSDGSTVVTGPQFLTLATTLGLINQAAPDAPAPVFSIIRPSSSFGLGSFSKVGGDFAADNSLNALINVGTGQVLIKIAGALADGSTGELVVPVANNWGELYQLNPKTVTDLLQKTSKFSPDLAAYINTLQSGHTVDQYGPSLFSQFSMFVTRDQVNSGNYVYQAYSGDSMVTAQVYDYLVACGQDAKGTYILGGPVTISTQNMLSLVSGVQYSRDGGQTVFYSSLLPGRSSSVSLKGFPTTVFTMMSGPTPGYGSGNTVDSDLANQVLAANSAYVDHVGKKASDQDAASELSYSETVMQALTSGKSSYTFPDVTAFKAVEVTDSTSYNLFQDATGNYYLKQSDSAAGATSNINGVQTVGYYAFNIAKPGDSVMTTVPTGVYFEVSGQKVTPRNVTYGATAQAMAAAHGVTISETTGQQTRALPVERAALAMTDADKNLAGGKDGTIMKLYQTAPLTVTKSGTKLYLYSNLANFSSLTQSGGGQLAPGQAPSDILLQSNPTKGNPYYMSLVTGTEYSIDGQPKSEDAYVFLPRAADKSFITTAPLVVWGEEQEMHLYAPNNFTTGADQTGFTEYTVNPGGIIYQYVDSSKKVYNFTTINPSTQAADGGVYKVDTSAPTVALKTWPLNSSSTQPQTIQTASNLSKALTEAASNGLIPSQRIYMMTAGSLDAGGAAQLQAAYGLANNTWSLYDVTDPNNPQAVGSFEPVANAKADQQINATVLHFLGTRGSGSTSVLFKKFTDTDRSALFNRVIVFTNSQSAAVVGFACVGSYFSPANGVYSNSVQDTQLSLTQAVSPALYCSGGSASANSACQAWPDQARGAQLPNDVTYYAIRSMGQTAPDLVYGPELPVLSSDALDQYYTSLKLRPIPSNRGVLTVVRNLTMSSLTQVTTDQVGRPAQAGATPEAYSDYKQRLLDSVSQFYDNKVTALQKGATQAATAIQNNNQAQQNFAYNPGTPRPASLQDQPPASIPAGPPVQRVIGNSSGYVTYLGQTSQSQATAINAQKTATLAQVNGLFTTIEQMIGKLYVDTSTSQLVFKIDKSDNLPVTSGYVSYPSPLDPSGGFLFDVNGIPTGDTLSLKDMQSLKAEVGGLVVAGTNPLRLALPKVVGDSSINIPNFVSHGAPVIPKPTAGNTPPPPTYTNAAPPTTTPSSSSPTTPSTPTGGAPAAPTSVAPAPQQTPPAQTIQPTQQQTKTAAPSAPTSPTVTTQPTLSATPTTTGSTPVRPNVAPRPVAKPATH